MTRLAKKCGALSKIGLALALFGGVMLGVSQTARALEAEDFDGAFFTNYFLDDNGIITVVNGTNQVPIEEPVSGNELQPICANLYFFTPDQQPAGCCQELVSSSGMAQILIAPALAAMAAKSKTGFLPPATGSVKIVASTPVGGRCNTQNPANLLSTSNHDTKNQLSAWITHTHSISLGNFTTEVPFSQTGEPENDWIQNSGSHLVTACFGGNTGACAGAHNPEFGQP